MRVLVTGAAGLVGSAVSRLLADSGYGVVGTYRRHPSGPVPGEAAILDILSGGHQGLVSLGTFDAVVHCAAALPSSLVGPEAERVAGYNMEIDRLIAAFAGATGADVVFASSSSVYREQGGGESTALDDGNPYSLSKIAGEKVMEEAAERAVSLRICAPYGVGQRSRTVLRIFIEKALAGHPLQYHGSGRRSQAFVHASDVAAAVEAALRLPVSGPFNIAGSRCVPMKELAHLVVDSIPGCASVVEPSGKEDPQENYRGCFDISRAARLLGWAPEVTLESGIVEMAEAIRQG
ncbi:NAD-dependent epimerase/dehydratase family protein [Salidesulfovibrio onnuriiensis]|uniref:NAD-dependent epimerase/dehydratase family protein n=1 Tax=Salidesulfovibrio onnuriiensis TaxID=2583823 RepID=UPI0011C939CC|nr:NAD(P)-dependent oxidoreductase [Salidesulfovibrio onnuriiensis]